MSNIEVELKVLISDLSGFVEKVNAVYPLSFLYKEDQLNHYFDSNGDLKKLSSFTNTDLPSLSNYSLRTRYTLRDDVETVLLVIKGSLIDSDHHNGSIRTESEYALDIPLSTLDHFISECGFNCVSKWSRQRLAYQSNSFTLNVDTNAGYGGVAEFELITDSLESSVYAKQELQKVIEDLSLVELDSARLNRMFNFYTKNWDLFYRTNNTFCIY